LIIHNYQLSIIFPVPPCFPTNNQQPATNNQQPTTVASDIRAALHSGNKFLIFSCRGEAFGQLILAFYNQDNYPNASPLQAPTDTITNNQQPTTNNQ